jgi:hypothetical protein
MTTTLSGGSWEVDASGETPPADIDVPVRRLLEERWRCGIAARQIQREAAFRLIYDAYVRSGLGVPNLYQMRVTPYHLLPTTTIFNAEWTGGQADGEVFSTVSLVGDGELGLPLERVYTAEVAERRAAGLRLAEVSCLADRRQDFRRFFPVFCALNRWMIQFARAQRYDQVLVAVHPKHARFYLRNMGFEPIGGLTNYPTVCNRPAVALCYDFQRNDRTPFPYYDRFFGAQLPLDVLQPAPMSPREVRLFGAMIDPQFHAEQLAAS